MRTPVLAAAAAAVVAVAFPFFVVPYVNYLHQRRVILANAVDRMNSDACNDLHERKAWQDECREAEIKIKHYWPPAAQAFYDVLMDYSICDAQRCSILGWSFTDSLWLFVGLSVLSIPCCFLCCYAYVRTNEYRAVARMYEMPTRNFLHVAPGPPVHAPPAPRSFPGLPSPTSGGRACGH